MMSTTKVLGIYGASGLGREVLELSRIINSRHERWASIVFIDDGNTAPEVEGSTVYSYEDVKRVYYSDLEIAMGIGEPSTRAKLFEKIRIDGIPLTTLVHPDVHLPKSTSIGSGTVIQYGCFVSCNVQIGECAYIQPHCNVGHDDVLEEGCVLSGFSNLAGGVRIGRYAYIGMSSAIKECVIIGKDCIIGMGSVVHKDVPAGMIAMGNPARVIAKNEDRRVFKH